jgi:hypothetical protein
MTWRLRSITKRVQASKGNELGSPADVSIGIIRDRVPRAPVGNLEVVP